MKNVHDIAKALAPKFGISVREAYYYADFIINTIHKKIATQQYNAISILPLGHFYICKNKILKHIKVCEDKLNKINSPEHFRNTSQEYRDDRRQRLEQEIEIFKERYNTLKEYRDKQQIFYDQKIKKQLARRMLNDQPTDTQKNGYARFTIDPLQRGVQPDTPQTKTTPFPMDTSPPDYL